MMADFTEGAIACLSESSNEVRECLGDILVKGFAYVPITKYFREAIASSFAVPYDQVASLSQNDAVKLGVQSINEPEVLDAFRFHAQLVDDLWAKQLAVA
jgi:hypothetical protein